MTRYCLKCDKEFNSSGNHNRLCKSCREGNKRISDRRVKIGSK